MLMRKSVSVILSDIRPVSPQLDTFLVQALKCWLLEPKTSNVYKSVTLFVRTGIGGALLLKADIVHQIYFEQSPES